MEPFLLPATELEAGLLPALPPLEIIVEWASLSSLAIGYFGAAMLISGWWVLIKRKRVPGWVKWAQWTNRLAIIGWCVGLLMAMAAPFYLVVVVPGVLLHALTLSRLDRVQMKLEAPPYPRLRLIHSTSSEPSKTSGELNLG